MMKTSSFLRELFLFGGLLGAQYEAIAQKWEHGISLGGSNYHGDLAKNIVLKETHPAFGLFSRYNFNEYWSLKSGLNYGKISGSDANFKEYKLRNLNFQSHLWELNSVFEFNYLPFGTNPRTSSLSSYAFFGLSLYRFNPQALFKEEWHDLRPLRTEEQTNNQTYNLVQLAVPFGGGIKYSITKNWVFGFELGWRKLFTDYLDDVSTVYPDRAEQIKAHGSLSADLSDRSWEVEGVGEPLASEGNWRGDPNFKDWYIFSMISFSYRITPITCWPKYSRF
jgi:hypothetical protein